MPGAVRSHALRPGAFRKCAANTKFFRGNDIIVAIGSSVSQFDPIMRVDYPIAFRLDAYITGLRLGIKVESMVGGYDGIMKTKLAQFVQRYAYEFEYTRYQAQCCFGIVLK